MAKKHIKEANPASISQPGSSGTACKASLSNASSSQEQSVVSKPSTSNENPVGLIATNQLYQINAALNSKRPKIDDALNHGNTLSAYVRAQNTEPNVIGPVLEGNQSQPPPARKKFNNLPNEILQNVIVRLETHNQISFRLVCHRWQGAIEELLEMTQCIKLNLPRCAYGLNSPVGQCHQLNPKVSLNSTRFETNCIESTLKFGKLAKLTIHSHHFTNANIDLIGRLFGKLKTVVIYYDYEEDRQEFTELHKLIAHFKEINSFNMIRSANPIANSNFIGNICSNLANNGVVLKHLRFYVNVKYANNSADRDRDTLADLLKLSPSLEDFALTSWPYNGQLLDQVLANVGTQLTATKPNENSEFNSLGIPLRTPQNIIQILEANRKLAKVRRLQLFQLKTFLQVRLFVQNCPRIQTLELHYNSDVWHHLSVEVNVFDNDYMGLIGRQEQLTELKLFFIKFARYSEGHYAPNIRKLTIGLVDFFTDLFSVSFRFTPHGRTAFADEFVKVMENKFPALEELTVLTHQKEGTSREKLNSANKISRMVKERIPTLKIVKFDLECDFLYRN